MAGRVGKRMREAEARAASEEIAPHGPTKRQLEARVRHLEEHLAWCEEHDLIVSIGRDTAALDDVRGKLERKEYR